MTLMNTYGHQITLKQHQPACDLELSDLSYWLLHAVQAFMKRWPQLDVIWVDALSTGEYLLTGYIGIDQISRLVDEEIALRKDYLENIYLDKQTEEVPTC